MWCAALAAIAGIALTDVSFRQRNVLVVFTAVFLLPLIFLVHALRHSYREKGRLIFDLNSFDVLMLTHWFVIRTLIGLS